MFPVHLDQIVTPYFNHMKHTAVLVWTLLELKLVPHVNVSKTLGNSLSIIFSVTYLLVVFWVYYKSGHWVYPIFGVLSGFEVSLFCLLTIFVYVLFYNFGRILVR